MQACSFHRFASHFGVNLGHLQFAAFSNGENHMSAGNRAPGSAGLALRDLPQIHPLALFGIACLWSLSAAVAAGTAGGRASHADAGKNEAAADTGKTTIRSG